MTRFVDSDILDDAFVKSARKPGKMLNPNVQKARPESPQRRFEREEVIRTERAMREAASNNQLRNKL